MFDVDFFANNRPKFGRIKLIECDFFTMVLDCTGCGQPMSYCSAVEMLKGMGFEIEARGKTKHESDFEIWRLPESRDTRQEDSTDVNKWTGS